jgi:hypothetical protein
LGIVDAGLVAASQVKEEQPALEPQRIVALRSEDRSGDGLYFACIIGDRKSSANQGKLDTSLCRPEKRVEEAERLDEHYIGG